MKINTASVAQYDELIDRYIESGKTEKPIIAAEIEAAFSVDATVFVLDLSGFSRLTAKRGIIFYLAMVRRMQRLSQQLIGDHDGTIVKFEADNLFAIFDTVDHALQFAWELKAGFAGMNIVTEADADIFISVGIASGKILLIDNRDMWGEAMNVASKLGEDLAKKSEILVHADSFETVEDQSQYRVEPRRYDISGISISAVSVLDIFG
ncbi:MAG: adenylate/guanylate cyclase domain-containing protein [Pikeienuella sp.]